MQKGTLFWIVAFGLLCSCSRLDVRRNCSDQGSRLRGFDYTSLVCGSQVSKYSVYTTYVGFSSEGGASEHLSGDSNFFKIPDTFMPKADSANRSTSFWDSILPLVNIYDISPRDWGPSPGDEPPGAQHWTLCAQFADNKINVPISEALAPVSSVSEAFLIAEKELSDYWIIESSEQLGQSIDSIANGYSMNLLHFERRCPNQCLGLVEVLCHEDGELEVVENRRRVRTFTCKCGPDALP